MKKLNHITSRTAKIELKDILAVATDLNHRPLIFCNNNGKPLTAIIDKQTHDEIIKAIEETEKGNFKEVDQFTALEKGYFSITIRTKHNDND